MAYLGSARRERQGDDRDVQLADLAVEDQASDHERDRRAHQRGDDQGPQQIAALAEVDGDDAEPVGAHAEDG